MSYPNIPGYQTPGASKEAAIAVRGRARVLRKQIVAYLKSQYPRGYTADEIAKHFGLSLLPVRPQTMVVREGTCQDWENEATFNKRSSMCSVQQALNEMQKVFGLPKKGNATCDGLAFGEDRKPVSPAQAA